MLATDDTRDGSRLRRPRKYRGTVAWPKSLVSGNVPVAVADPVAVVHLRLQEDEPLELSRLIAAFATA